MKCSRLRSVAQLVWEMAPGDPEQTTCESLILLSHKLPCNAGKPPGCAASIFPPVTHSQGWPTSYAVPETWLFVTITLKTCKKDEKCHQESRRYWCVHPGGRVAAWRAPRLLQSSSLQGPTYQAEGSFCAHLLEFANKARLWGWRFIDRLPLSQGTEEGKRKNQRMRQALPGGNTSEDKFPLSVSKDFSSSYLIPFQSNVSRDFSTFLLRALASVTTLSVSLSALISPNAPCAVIGVLS